MTALKPADPELFYPCMQPLVIGALAPHITRDPAGIVASYVLGNEEPFGAEAWKRYFGLELEKEPAFPAALHSFMYGPDPIEPSKRCFETHLGPVFRPSFITLNVLGKLIRTPKEGYPSKFYGIDSVISQNGNKRAGPDCWLMLRRGIFERKGQLAGGIEFMCQLNAKTNAGYEPEPSVIDLATVVFTERVKTGKFHLGGNQGMQGRVSYSYAKETYITISRTVSNLIVGEFSDEGLVIADSFLCSDSEGIAAIRRFESI